ncbi:MAG: helix-turn-helix domain-containing protein [Pseudomonadota bacterium]
MIAEEGKPAHTKDDAITVLAAAKIIGVHHTTLYRQINADKIAAFKFGGIVFIPMREVLRLKREKEAKCRSNPRT